MDPKSRARLSLDGLSIGDAFGQRFFFPWVVEQSGPDKLPDPPWYYTDDTEMAIAIIQTLESRGVIDQAELAQRFADRFRAEPGRGYGAGARQLLIDIGKGADWKQASRDMFGGSGSYGNGGAMRVAPLGAWFAEDFDAVIAQADLSAEVTHAHAEGRIGAIAVALAAAWVWQNSQLAEKWKPADLIPFVIERIERSEVRDRLEWAATFPLDTWAFTVASQVGNGSQISAQDTVPLCLWLAAAHMNDFCEAMWTTARIGGDIDTNCAIVGGIVALSVGPDGIPQKWRDYRERLAL